MAQLVWGGDYVMLLHSQGCCPQTHGIRKTDVFPRFCSGDGLCQSLHPTLPHLLWKWQHSFVSKVAGAGSQASNQLSEMWWGTPRGAHSLGSCREGLGGWLGFPSSRRGGGEEPEMNTVLETAGPNFLQLFTFSRPSFTPCLKVKPRKIIIGFWDVSICVLHPLWFYKERKRVPRRTKELPKANLLEYRLQTGVHRPRLALCRFPPPPRFSEM